MILKIFKTLDEKYLRVISKLKPSFFCYFFNLRQFLIFRKLTSFHYSKKLKLFFAREDNLLIYFFSTYRQSRLYSRGIKKRLDDLANNYFLNNIKFKNNDYVVDCGANIGELKIVLDRICQKKISYIGFEPSPNEFRCLSQNVYNQKYYQIALSDISNKQKFFISSEEADNSLIEPKHYSEFINLKTDRLDRILPTQKIKLLKIDAEGAEIEVLKGCENIFNNIEYISVDLGPERGVNSVPTFKEVIPFLIKKGFMVEKISQKRYTFLFFNTNCY